MLSLQHNGKNYQWARLSSGRGAWLKENVIVHLTLDHELTQQARAAGLNDGLDFARFPPTPEKEKPVRTRGNGKRSVSVKARHAVKLRLKL